MKKKVADWKKWSSKPNTEYTKWLAFEQSKTHYKENANPI
jgi:hypothetical protein